MAAELWACREWMRSGRGQGTARARPAVPPRRGVVQELLVFVVGFVTSLLPAWNFNAEDAAAMAAAQEAAAAEERERQRRAAAGAAAAAEGAAVQ
jgi:hypothetical protein